MIKKLVDKFIQDSKGPNCQKCKRRKEIFDDSFVTVDDLEGVFEFNADGLDDNSLQENHLHEERDIEKIDEEESTIYDLPF